MAADFISIYQKHIPSLKRGSMDEWNGKCPFRRCASKSKSKFYVNEMSGDYYCQRCKAGGNAITFAKHFGEDYAPYTDVSTVSADAQRSISLSRLPADQISLAANPEKMPRPWTPGIAHQLGIGWNRGLIFPVNDEGGQLVNIMKHKGPQWPGSSATLYPLDLLVHYDQSYVVISEGMKDCVSLLAVGVQATTSTAGSCPPENIALLKGFRRIYLCLDNDRAGDDGVDKWLMRLRHDFPQVKLRVCDLGPLTEVGGDVTDYLSLPEKNRGSFIKEVLDCARVGLPYSDVPDFVRQTILSEEFLRLPSRDRLIFVELLFRVSRYRVIINDMKGIRVLVGPGQYVTSIPLLNERYEDLSNKQIRTSLEHLRNAGFLTWEDLKNKRGRLLTITGWVQRIGQPTGQQFEVDSENENYPMFLSDSSTNRTEVQSTKFDVNGSKPGPHKGIDTLEGKDLYKREVKRKVEQNKIVPAIDGLSA